MVAPHTPGETLAEAAARHGRSLDTARNHWSRHPDWPAPLGKRGRAHVYDPAAVDAFVARQLPDLEAARLYTARDLEAAGLGIKAATIRADQSKGRWPEPDDTTGGANRWYGSTVKAALAGRRSYRRTSD